MNDFWWGGSEAGVELFTSLFCWYKNTLIRWKTGRNTKRSGDDDDDHDDDNDNDDKNDDDDDDHDDTNDDDKEVSVIVRRFLFVVLPVFHLIKVFLCQQNCEVNNSTSGSDPPHQR